jgi:hypothetical protein
MKTNASDTVSPKWNIHVTLLICFDIVIGCLSLSTNSVLMVLWAVDGTKALDMILTSFRRSASLVSVPIQTYHLIIRVCRLSLLWAHMPCTKKNKTVLGSLASLNFCQQTSFKFLRSSPLTLSSSFSLYSRPYNWHYRPKSSIEKQSVRVSFKRWFRNSSSPALLTNRNQQASFTIRMNSTIILLTSWFPYPLAWSWCQPYSSYFNRWVTLIPHHLPHELNYIIVWELCWNRRRGYSHVRYLYSFIAPIDVTIYFTNIVVIMTMRLVLNLRQVGSNTVHGSTGTISSLGDIPEPAFATNSAFGNIGAPLRVIDDDERGYW